MNTAAEMTAMMKTVITHGTGRAANIGKPAAGKTGTTDDNKDAYFMGYTPNIVTGVWVGNDDNTVMNKSIQGGTVPALIWKDIMKVATEPYGKVDFNYPQIELMPFAAGSNVKIIGEENKQEEKETETEEQSQTSAEPVKVDLPESIKKIEQQMPVNNPHPVTATPKPAFPVKETSAPVPMAVPESLH